MKKQAHYHNTVDHSGQQLQSYEAKAYTQEQQVADFFTSHPGELYTPWEIQALVFKFPKPPITSVRRSMSNLTRDGILTKTTEKKEVGSYGRASYCWMVNAKYYETLMAMEIVFAPEPPKEGLKMGDLLEPVLEAAKRIKSENGPKTSPQGKLFEVPPAVDPPVHCSLCGKELTKPASMIKGVGPVCEGKCKESVEILGPGGEICREQVKAITAKRKA